MNASRLISEPRFAEGALTLGTCALIGLGALVVLRGLFPFLDDEALTFAIPLFSATCARAVFYSARRREERYLPASLVAAAVVGSVNALVLFAIVGPASVVVSTAIVVVAILGAVFGLGFGLALLPAIYFARLERKQPTVDWSARVPMVLSIYAAIIVVAGLILEPMFFVPSGTTTIATIAFAILVVMALVKDARLLMLVQRARKGTRGLRLQERGERSLPLLFRPVAFEPYDALVQLRSRNGGPFRDERTERALAWVPRGAPRTLYLRVVCELALLGSVALMVLEGYTP